MGEITCKVCGAQYPDKRKSCPRCGCRKGEAVPAYLRCKRCGTTLPSRNAACPGCGQEISPRTATAILLPPVRNVDRRKALVWWGTGIAITLLLLIGEFFWVKSIYADDAYIQIKELWGDPVDISKNRREPDPVYKAPPSPAPKSTTDVKPLEEVSETVSEGTISSAEDLPIAEPEIREEDISVSDVE